jgi:hypothetical protein
MGDTGNTFLPEHLKEKVVWESRMKLGGYYYYYY